MTWTRIKSFYRYPKTCYSVMTAGTIILAPESVEDAVVSFAFRTGGVYLPVAARSRNGHGFGMAIKV